MHCFNHSHAARRIKMKNQLKKDEESRWQCSRCCSICNLAWCKYQEGHRTVNPYTGRALTGPHLCEACFYKKKKDWDKWWDFGDEERWRRTLAPPQKPEEGAGAEHEEVKKTLSTQSANITKQANVSAFVWAPPPTQPISCPPTRPISCHH